MANTSLLPLLSSLVLKWMMLQLLKHALGNKHLLLLSHNFGCQCINLIPCVLKKCNQILTSLTNNFIKIPWIFLTMQKMLSVINHIILSLANAVLHTVVSSANAFAYYKCLFYMGSIISPLCDIPTLRLSCFQDLSLQNIGHRNPILTVEQLAYSSNYCI